MTSEKQEDKNRPLFAEYLKLLNEIDILTKLHKFSPSQVLMLQISASFKTNQLDYDSLLKEFKINNAHSEQ